MLFVLPLDLTAFPLTVLEPPALALCEEDDCEEEVATLVLPEVPLELRTEEAVLVCAWLLTMRVPLFLTSFPVMM